MIAYSSYHESGLTANQHANLGKFTGKCYLAKLLCMTPSQFQDFLRVMHFKLMFHLQYLQTRNTSYMGTICTTMLKLIGKKNR